MSDKSISFHFSETNTPTTFSTLHGLSRHRINRPCRSDLEFVVHHVSETLIVDNAEVDIRSKFLTCDTRIHRFVAPVVVTSGYKLFTEMVNGGVLFVEPFNTCDCELANIQ